MNAEQRLKLVLDFINAPTWRKAKHFLEEHPELLTNEADALLEALAAVQENDEVREQVAWRRRLLQRSRRIGIDQAFAELSLRPQPRLLKQARSALEKEGQGALDSAIAAWDNVLKDSSFSNAPEVFRAAVCHDAGRAYFRRYQVEHRSHDLERALDLWREAVKLTPPGTTERPSRLNDLGVGQSERYALTSQEKDLKGAVDAFREAVTFAAQEHPERPLYLTHLGIFLSQQFALTERDADLNSAIAAFREAAALTTSGALERPRRLTNLGTALSARYVRKEQEADLKEAVDAFKEAVTLTAPDAPERLEFLTYLGAGLLELYQRTEQGGNLDASIAAYKEALALASSDSPERATLLGDFGKSLQERYARTGQTDDLKQAITAYKKALNLTDTDSPECPIYLENLGTCLRARYRQVGRQLYIKPAIEAFRRAVDLTAPDAAERFARLNKLGSSLSARYSGTGEKEFLEQAIKAYSEALLLTESEAEVFYHRRRSESELAELLSNYGAALRKRYDRTGQAEDLDAAIHASEQAVVLTPHEGPDYPRYLSNLGSNLGRRYVRTGRKEDLSVAIATYRVAVGLDAAAPGSPGSAGRLANLGDGLRKLYALTGREQDLKEAIDVSEQALRLTDPNAPRWERSHRLNNLGNTLLARYGHTGKSEDLEAGIKHYRQAVDLTAHGIPERIDYLTNLGTALRLRYSWKEATDAYRDACRQGLESFPEKTLMGGRNWGLWALERNQWKDATEAFDFALQATERLLEAQLPRAHKEDWLVKAQGLPAAAAYALARTGALEEAVETLESGRARLLSETLERHRQDLERLPALGYSELHQDYLQASQHWEDLHYQSKPAHSEVLASQDALRSKIEAIRKVPGYETFLGALTFEQIQTAAHAGPLIYLLATVAGGLALIVPVSSDDSGQPASVQALWLDTLRSTVLQEKLLRDASEQSLGGYLGAYARHVDARNSAAFAAWLEALEQMSRWLGEVLMGPLLEALKLMPAEGTDERDWLPRVTLVATGLLGLLPLHAACIDDQSQPGVRRYAIDAATFCYAPNARSLIAAQSLVDNLPPERLLLMVEPQPVEANRLPGAEAEAKAIIPWWPDEARTTRWHVAATLDELQELLPKHTIFHFAGHAYAGWGEPLNGGLLVADSKVLTVRAWQASRLQLRLAVLSACETGVPGIHVPDEVTGLPAALVEAGTAGVVASLWAVEDESTGRLMEHFYRAWRGQGLPPPVALRQAQLTLRSEGDTHPHYWAAFTYTGL